MYKILASDGNEYDSIPADKIREWILENRVESKTPVMPEDAADWAFLGDLPEFAESFAALQKREAAGPAKGLSRGRMIGIALLLAAVTAGVVVLFFLKKTKGH
jgi:hypothetical protein